MHMVTPTNTPATMPPKAPLERPEADAPSNLKVGHNRYHKIR